MANRSSNHGRHSTLSARKILVSACSALLCVAVVAGQSSDRARTEALAKRAGDRLVALQREADRLAHEEGTLLNNLRKLEVERQIRTEELKQADAALAAVRADIDTAGARIETLTATAVAERPGLDARLVEMYKLGRARYARLLLSAPDLRRVGEASRTVAVLARLDRDRIAEHQQTLTALTSERATLDARQRELAAARNT